MRQPIRGNDLLKKLDLIEKRDAEMFLAAIKRGRGKGKTLRNTMRIRRGRNAAAGLGLGAFVGSYEVVSPFYWARFYHDGRGPVRPKKPRGWLAFYPNADDDPRLAGLSLKYPRFRSEVRSLRDLLDDESFDADVRSGRLILTKRFKAWKGNPVIDRAAQRYATSREAGIELSDYTEAHLTGYLDSFIESVRGKAEVSKIKAVVSSRVPKGAK